MVKQANSVQASRTPESGEQAHVLHPSKYLTQPLGSGPHAGAQDAQQAP